MQLLSCALLCRDVIFRAPPRGEKRYVYLDPEGAGGKYGFRLQVSAGTMTHMHMYVQCTTVEPLYNRHIWGQSFSHNAEVEFFDEL